MRHYTLRILAIQVQTMALITENQCPTCRRKLWPFIHAVAQLAGYILGSSDGRKYPIDERE